MAMTCRNGQKLDQLEQRIMIEDNPHEINRGKNLVYLQMYNHLTNAVESLEGKPGEITFTAQELFLPQHLIFNLEDKNYHCNAQEKFIKLSVSDNGHGISEKCLNEIYKPGVSGKGSSGVGLALTELICRRLKGFEVVKSELNVGTTFELYMPKDSKLSSL